MGAQSKQLRTREESECMKMFLKFLLVFIITAGSIALTGCYTVRPPPLPAPPGLPHLPPPPPIPVP